ncbi:MAG: hypothetical protein QUS08_06350, partial [Methanothrix sp.]|nr:hypothetical protein [Methanothrix sp.]
IALASLAGLLVFDILSSVSDEQSAGRGFMAALVGGDLATGKSSSAAGLNASANSTEGGSSTTAPSRSTAPVVMLSAGGSDGGSDNHRPIRRQSGGGSSSSGKSSSGAQAAGLPVNASQNLSGSGQPQAAGESPAKGGLVRLEFKAGPATEPQEKESPAKSSLVRLEFKAEPATERVAGESSGRQALSGGRDGTTSRAYRSRDQATGGGARIQSMRAEHAAARSRVTAAQRTRAQRG